MKQPIFMTAPDLSKWFVHAYFHDLNTDDILAALNRDKITLIATALHEFILDPQEVEFYIRERQKVSAPLAVRNDTYHLACCSADSCTVLAAAEFEARPETERFYRVSGRFSFHYQLVNGQLLLAHLHLSVPWSAMQNEDYFPHKFAKENYAYLQDELEKVKTINRFLSDALPSGIAGNYDRASDDYPCFYLNQSLLSLLGYEQRECLTGEGATMFGLLHDLDLPRVKKELTAALGNAPEYSIRYRLKKKNGEPLWVLDTGKRITLPDRTKVLARILIPLPEEANVPATSTEKSLPLPLSLPPLSLFADTMLEILNHTAKLPDAIESSLELLGKALGLGRVCIGLFGKSQPPYRIVWQWNAENIPPMPDLSDTKKAELLLHFDVEHLDFCNDTRELPAHHPDCVRHLSVRSYARCLLRKNNEKIGILCFQHTENTHTWAQDEIDLLQTAGKILTNPVIWALREED